MPMSNTISKHDFMVIWNNHDLTNAEVTKQTGYTCFRDAKARAKHFELPERPKEPAGRKPRITDKHKNIFSIMWEEGLGVKVMATYFGVSNTTIANAYKRFNLKPRPPGHFNGISMKEFIQRRKHILSEI